MFLNTLQERRHVVPSYGFSMLGIRDLRFLSMLSLSLSQRLWHFALNIYTYRYTPNKQCAAQSVPAAATTMTMSETETTPVMAGSSAEAGTTVAAAVASGSLAWCGRDASGRHFAYFSACIAVAYWNSVAERATLRSGSSLISDRRCVHICQCQRCATKCRPRLALTRRKVGACGLRNAVASKSQNCITDAFAIAASAAVVTLIVSVMYTSPNSNSFCSSHFHTSCKWIWTWAGARHDFLIDL